MLCMTTFKTLKLMPQMITTLNISRSVLLTGGAPDLAGGGLSATFFLRRHE